MSLVPDPQQSASVVDAIRNLSNTVDATAHALQEARERKERQDLADARTARIIEMMNPAPAPAPPAPQQYLYNHWTGALVPADTRPLGETTIANWQAAQQARQAAGSADPRFNSNLPMIRGVPASLR